MEGLRLWDPPRQQKEQIILDNWDMLQLDNIKQTDLTRISDNMMQVSQPSEGGVDQTPQSIHPSVRSCGMTSSTR